MIKHPFFGWPVTEPLYDEDEGARGYRVDAAHRTPFTIKLADGITSAITFMLVLVILSHGHEDMLIHLVLLIPLYAGLWRLLRLVIRKRTKVDFWRNNNDGTKTVLIGKDEYPAAGITGFGGEEHEKSELEGRQQSAKVQIGKLKVTRAEEFRLYQDSYHVQMEYAGQPLIIADVYGKRDASKLIARLNALHVLITNDAAWEAWGFDSDPEETKRKNNCFNTVAGALFLSFLFLIGPFLIGVALGIIQLFTGPFEVLWIVKVALVVGLTVVVLWPLEYSPHPKEWLWSSVCQPIFSIISNK